MSETNGQALAPTVTADQLELIKKTVANGATADELKLYLFDCARQGVHPLDKLVHFTKRGGKYTPVTSIDFMRIRAAESGEMAGSDDPLFEAVEMGQPPFSATVTVYRMTQGQRFPYTATARWSEYKPDQDFMWRKMPHTMLAKCAEALALRKGFPRQLAGLYAKEEMDQAGESNVGYTVTAPSVTSAIPSASGGKDVPAASTGDIAASTPIRAPFAAAVPPVPTGAVLITKVEPGPRGSKAKGFLRTSTMRADEDGLALYDDRLKGQAEQFCQDGVPVVLGVRHPASGKDYVTSLAVAATGELREENEEMLAEMVTGDDIPF